MDLKTIVRNSLYFGVGAISMTREKVEEVVADLVKKGEMTRGEGKRFADEVTKSIEKARKEIDGQIQKGTKKAAEALNLVTMDEIQKLERKVNRLRNEVKKLTGNPAKRKKSGR